MGIIWTIIIGFVIGLVARLVKPGDDNAGFLATTALGVVGALVGTFIGKTLGMYQPDQPAGFLMSVVGAVLVLFIYQQVVKKQRPVL